MTTSRDVLASSPDICPGQISWDYDRAEIIADGVVHAIGVCLGLIGVTIVMIAVNIERIEIAPITVYVIGLVTMLALSAAYNISPAKWVLRRFDHSAIYLLIAGTYTPFLAQMKNVLASAGVGSRPLAYLQLVSRTCR
jgi:hemolysin III